MTVAQKKQSVVKKTYYYLILGNLYKLGENGILAWCVLENKSPMILTKSHEGIVGGHYVGKETRKKIFLQGFGGPHYIRMLKNIFIHAMFFKGW